MLTNADTPSDAAYALAGIYVNPKTIVTPRETRAREGAETGAPDVNQEGRSTPDPRQEDLAAA